MSDGFTTERKIEILRALRNDSLFGLVSVELDRGDGVILYERGASRVGGEPAIEIPHEDPYLVDESTMKDPLTGKTERVPGVQPPEKSFTELLSEYGCVAKKADGFTYVVVDEDACSGRPPRGGN